MIDPYEKLIKIMKKIPKNTFWSHIELSVICAILERNNGNRTKTAYELDLSIRTIRNKINLAKKYGFCPQDSLKINVGRPKKNSFPIKS